MKHYIFLFSLIISVLGCSPSSEQDKRRHNQFNDIEEEKAQEDSKAKKLANSYNAIFVKPYSRDWSQKYTYELQEQFSGKKIIFETNLVDIYKNKNTYQLKFGNSFLSHTTFILTSTLDDAINITKAETKRMVVVATIKSIKPLLINNNDSDPMTVAVDKMAYGQSYLVNGVLDDYIIEKNPNN